MKQAGLTSNTDPKPKKTLILDFKGIIGGEISGHTTPETPPEPLKDDTQQEVPIADKKAPGKLLEALRGISAEELMAKRSREKEEREKAYNRCISIAKKYEERENVSRRSKRALFKLLKAGAPLPTLFLKACFIISLLSNDNMFYKSIEQDLKEIYGEILEDPQEVEHLLNEARNRLERLIKAEALEEDPRKKQRIANAVYEHQQLVKDLEGKLNEDRANKEY